MKKILFPLFLVLFVLAGSLSFAQAKQLAITENTIVIDGAVTPDEYSFSQDLGRMKVSVNRGADALSIAVVGSTTGWVAVGIGSMRMNGSAIFMGFVDSSGKVQFKPQAGQGHTHSDTGQAVQDTVISYTMKETNGATTIEMALKPGAYIKTGQTELDLIFAQGPADSFTPLHMFRGSLAIKLVE